MVARRVRVDVVHPEWTEGRAGGIRGWRGPIPAVVVRVFEGEVKGGK